ncbi:MAG: pseudouridine synthase [Saprospiraceae bacterium]|nr:pseudouridine synthase [Saprospiraceae bacterium]
MSENCFTPFQSSISDYPLPEKFTFPFYYDPHPLCLLASKELQRHIETQTEWEYDFGLEEEKPDVIIGKMFGVLVVQNEQNEIGYLSSFSGKLGDSSHYSKFVPPIIDVWEVDNFLNIGMEELNTINQEIKKLESLPEFVSCMNIMENDQLIAASQIEEQREKMRNSKKERKLIRQREKESNSPEDFEEINKELNQQSINGKKELKRLLEFWKDRSDQNKRKVDQIKTTIDELKLKRKNKSAGLQKKIFDQYRFLNQAGEVKSLLDIFKDKTPMGGTGECAAPKLLQYAFKFNMKPLAMAEFWWGQSPKSEIRKHRNFYPACIGKCKPLLSHMLEGIEMDENPLLKNPAEGKEIEIIFEDEHILVINKPAEFLSVPGRYIKDSVAQRMKEKFPNATGPLIVHRLDMSTSGIMLIAKSLEVHKFLQSQFIKRTIKKRYVALLEGIVNEKEGIVDLPLRTDWNERPKQLVCHESGKSAQTKWKVIERKNQQTRIHFFPITGRTHQLRVHAAHPLGLNLPIFGDDLYGTKSKRLCLHAEWIEFVHPISREVKSVTVEAEF